MRNLIFCETPDDVADAAADLIFAAQKEAIAERGSYRIALSGGSTPKLLYETLASTEWGDEMAWEQWEVFWGDERAVPPDSKDSNFCMAYDALLAHVPIDDVWRMHGEALDLQEAAATYARTLRSRFEHSNPVFDTILLGMGPDGHTASLFPNHPALNSERLVEVVEVDMPVRMRLTLTLPVINQARQIIFLITGQEKADKVKEIISADNETYPAARVTPLSGECLWILDESAASKIR